MNLKDHIVMWNHALIEVIDIRKTLSLRENLRCCTAFQPVHIVNVD